MKEKEILQVIKGLSKSQGFYCRLYNALIEAMENNKECYKEFMEELENQNFKSAIDMILYLEN